MTSRKNVPHERPAASVQPAPRPLADHELTAASGGSGKRKGGASGTPEKFLVIRMSTLLVSG